MTTRFNTFNSTGGVAQENTLEKIREELRGVIKVSVEEDNSTGNNVNIVEVNNQPVSANTGNVEPGTLRVVLPDNQPAVDVNIVGGSLPGTTNSNLIQIAGNGVQVGNGTGLHPGVQRIMLANDLDTSGWGNVKTDIVAQSVGNLNVNISSQTSAPITSNIQEFNGNTISTADGTTNPGTLRVTLADDQKTGSWEDIPIKNGVTGDITTNLKQIDDQKINTGIGTVDTGTQRVTLGSDQPFNGAASLPVQIKRNFEFTKHETFWGQQSAINNGYSFMDGSGVNLFSLAGAINAAVLLPVAATNMYVYSTSANDVVAGTGLQSVIVRYIDSPAATIIQMAVVAMNGAAGQSITGGNNIYRIISVFPGSTGANNFNSGLIRIGNLAQTAYYPGEMAILTNRWLTSHIVVPNATSANYLNTTKYNTIVFDYINWHVENNAGTTERLRVYARDVTVGSQQASPWYVVMQIDTNDKFDVKYTLNNAILPAGGYEFAYLVNKTNGLGTMYFTVSVGLHRE